MIQQFHSWVHIFKKENKLIQKDMHLDVHSSTVYNCRDIETA